MNVSIRYVLVVCACLAVLGCGSSSVSLQEGDIKLTDTPIYVAIRNNDLDAVKVAVANDPGALHSTDGVLGATPLHEAVGADNIAIAAYLIESGADVNAVDIRGVTPLTTAMDAEASEAIIELLRTNGGDD